MNTPQTSHHHERPLSAVTGASRGIGREVESELARRGYDLILGAEDDELEAAAAAVRHECAGVWTVRGDLREPAGVDAFYTRGSSEH